MDNSIIKKLINKINADIAEKFDLSVIKKLAFIPINLQNDVFFVAIYSNSDKDKIREYVASVIEYKLEFIYLTKENFARL